MTTVGARAKAETEYATSTKIAPVDIGISVDNDLIRFVARETCHLK